MRIPCPQLGMKRRRCISLNGMQPKVYSRPEFVPCILPARWCLGNDLENTMNGNEGIGRVAGKQKQNPFIERKTKWNQKTSGSAQCFVSGCSNSTCHSLKVGPRPRRQPLGTVRAAWLQGAACGTMSAAGRFASNRNQHSKLPSASRSKYASGPRQHIAIRRIIPIH
jgi:hypothetical protein